MLQRSGVQFHAKNINSIRGTFGVILLVWLLLNPFYVFSSVNRGFRARLIASWGVMVTTLGSLSLNLTWDSAQGWEPTHKILFIRRFACLERCYSLFIGLSLGKDGVMCISKRKIDIGVGGKNFRLMPLHLGWCYGRCGAFFRFSINWNDLAQLCLFVLWGTKKFMRNS